MPTDTTNDLAEVELIERDRFELAREATSEPVGRDVAIGSKAIVVASIAVIVLALAIISRPGASVAVDETAGQTTVPAPTTSLPDQASSAGSELETTVVTQSIPLFSDNISSGIPGVISAVDRDGSLIVIDRTRVRPQESRLGMVPTFENPKATLILDGSAPIPVDRELFFNGTQIFVQHDDDRFLAPSFALDDIAPGQEGNALLVSHLPDSQLAVVVPLEWDGTNPESLLQWEVPGYGLDISGVWGNELVVHQANKVWLLDAESNATLVGEGRLLSYDGANLARLVCEEPDQCVLAVGPPDQPEARTLPLPDMLAVLDIDDWAGSVSISPDGRRLGTSVRFGVLSLPVVVDLTNGETESLADGMNRQAPVAWSPDGEWLAYVYTDDVMVWSVAEGRSWRIEVNRELETLVWR